MNTAAIEDIRTVREGYSEAGEWTVATLTCNGESSLAIRWKSRTMPGFTVAGDWFILPEQFARPVLDAALRWDPQAEEAIRRGYEEQAAYEASVDDPYPWDPPYEEPALQQAPLKEEAA